VSLSEKHGRRINDFQLAEIVKLATDVTFAERCSHMPHYSRVGDWLDLDLGRSALELGCGPGRYVAMLASIGFDVTGVDPLPFPSWHVIEKHQAVQFRDGISAEDLPFEDESFDHITCIGTMLYLHDTDRALEEIKRVLRPNGRLVVRTVNRRNLYTLRTGRPIDPAGKRLYSEAELRRVLAGAGFGVTSSFAYGFFPPFATELWWYWLNGTISVRTQGMLSAITPRGNRANVTIFAYKPDGSTGTADM
jgi:ubiquinone/menaquinone biosynthesis C-methylase UbiE